MFLLIKKLFFCKLLKSHYWTDANAQGIKPTKEQLKSCEGFAEYAVSYCERCGTVYYKSVELIQSCREADIKLQEESKK